MINFRVEGNSTYIKACAFVFVILIQTLLTGYRYVQFCFAYHDQCIIGKNTTWYTWIAYWTIVFFTLNIIPIVYILLKFKHHKKDYFCYLYKHDATFVILFSYQLFNVILYYVIAMIQYYTVWPGSDRVYQCCNSIRFLLMYLHNANHLVLLDRLGKLIPTLKKIKKVPKN
ncbi:hypothetical protein BC833DRAFT_608449 [Globomyces pollinis-pini]|nr:hypothetical protein BC833DRAFT_608449 [Globomyces pollinis-pini]